MRVLIVQSKVPLGNIWQRHLQRLGAEVEIALTGTEAVKKIETTKYDVIVLDLVLGEGSALTVGDVAFFRQPDANLIYVTDTTFFSDGSIFNHSANARAFIETSTPPSDLAAIVQHYGESISHAHGARKNQARGLSG